MVQRLLSSYRYFVFFASIASACSLLSRRPEYSTMKVRLAIGSVANSPRPVRERPMRKGFFLRDIRGELHTDSRLSKWEIARFPAVALKWRASSVEGSHALRALLLAGNSRSRRIRAPCARGGRYRLYRCGTQTRQRRDRSGARPQTRSASALCAPLSQGRQARHRADCEYPAVSRRQTWSRSEGGSGKALDQSIAAYRHRPRGRNP